MIPLVHYDKISSIRVNFSLLGLKLVSRIGFLFKNSRSRYNFLSKITRTDAK
ncbi:hypothetical protein MNBD_BACTEROID04-469 [hydrothermal vent metagenome]|uniref:Uncharacterized protein n=1 Tax=hydrothermal vent metagenome TaxID=652676 RepID=A0A3B0UCG8_9ZZZZ